MKFSNDFWRHILIGGGGAAGLALIQFLGHQDFGQWNVLAQLVFQGGAELLNQVVAQDKVPPAVGGVGGRDPNIMRGLSILVAMGVVLAMAPGHARADPKPIVVARSQTPIEFNNGAASGSTTTANASSALSSALGDIINFFSTDFDDAAALAVAIPSLQDNNGAACWKQASSIGVLLKAHPLPVTFKAATDFEALRLFSMAVNQMCQNPACTQVFTDLSNGVAQIGVGIPIPSLTSLCAKVPTITPGPVQVTNISTAITNLVPNSLTIVPPK